jgi:hypothetical protein
MVEKLDEAAMAVVSDFIYRQRAGGVPALMGACVLWTVEHGAAELMRETLKNLSDLVDDMESAQKAASN